VPTGSLTPRGNSAQTWMAVNGRIVPEDEARVSCADRGFLYGDGLFETMKARQGEVDFLEKHLERLRLGALELGLPSPPPLLPSLVRELLTRNGPTEHAAVKLCLTRGKHTGALTLYEPTRPTVVLSSRPWEEPAPSRWEQGLSITVETGMRQNPRSGICHLKTLNYLPYLLARTRAEQAGFQDAVLLNPGGEVCECTSSNLFWFRQGRLETPEASCGLLPGVARAVLLDLMKRAGTPVCEVKSSADRLQEADEVFVTNSLLEIMPVGRIDERHYVRREKTREILKRFRALRDALHPVAG
jgi:branched-chain amino acid aminotransferase